MALSLTQTATVRVVEGQGITNNLLRLLALSPSVSISGSVATADLAAGAVTPAKTTPGAYFYGTSSGTNTYTVALNPPLGALANGAEVLVKMGISNTAAATASLNVDSLGAKNIYHRNGIAVKPGDLVADDIVRFRYNTSRNTAAGGWDVMEVLPSALIRPATNETAGTATVQTVVNTPPLTAYAAGVLLLVKVGASLTNTGSLTLNCDGLGTRNVLRPGAAALLAGDWTAGQTYLVYDDGTQFILLTKDKDVAVVASARNLLVFNNTGTPNSKMDITADEVVLKTSDGVAYLASTVSVTADMSLGVSANGLDAGTEAANTWYYLWLIYNGTTVASLISTSATAPTLPTGYTHKALVGQVRNDNSSNFVVTRIVDRRAFIATQDIAATITGVTAYTALTGTPATEFAKFVPPIAKTAFIILGKIANADYGAAVAADTSGNFEQIQSGTGTGTTFNGMAGASFFEVVMSTAQLFSWKVDATTANGYKLQCTGYTF